MTHASHQPQAPSRREQSRIAGLSSPAPRPHRHSRFHVFVPLFVLMLPVFCLVNMPKYGAVAHAAIQLARDPASEADVVGERIQREREEKERPIYRKPQIERESEPPKPTPLEAVTFTLTAVEIEGNTVLPDKTFAPLIEPSQGRQVSLQDLQAIADAIEKEYRRQGYLTTIAYVPPQKIQEGRATISVLESHLGEVVVEGNRYFNTTRIRNYWTPKHGDILRYQDMVKSLARMNKHPDREVQAALRAGKTAGETDVILKVTDRLPIHAGGQWDRLGTKPIGQFRYGASIRHNNFLGLDDRLVAGGVFGKDFGAAYTNYSLPITSFGTSLMYQFSHSRASPKRQFKPFGVHGRSTTHTIAVIQSIAEQEKLSVEAQLGLDFKESRTLVQADTSRRDRLRVLRFEPHLQYTDEWGRWLVNNEYAFGLRWFGASSENNPLASRPGADPDFFKFGLQVTRIQPMPWKTQAVVSVETQISPSKLTPQEQLYLGGASSVRGYPEGDYLADQGIIVRTEYHVPCRFLPERVRIPGLHEPLKDQLQMVGFVDHGHGRLRAITGDEGASRNMLGIGAGLRLHIQRRLSASVEFGFNVGDKPLTDDSNHVLHFTLQFDF